MHATPIFDELTERLREPWSEPWSEPERPADRYEPVGAVVGGGTGETVLSFAAPSRGRHARPR
jgi:hypothetical protein